MRTHILVETGFILFGLVLPSLADQPSVARPRVTEASLCGSDAAKRPPPIGEWTDDEAEQLWNTHSPESARGKKFRDPIRTAHYIVLTNSSCGEGFGRRMEENYRRVRELFPFNEPPGARKMPILLFRTNSEFQRFLVDSLGYDEASAKGVKGIARGEFYATWYESPIDPVHLHEATHQIFTNRMGLTGAGSWFQEGVAEYASSSKNDRNAVANRIAAGQMPSLMTLIDAPDIAHSTLERGVTGRRATCARERYLHAALFIEFLKESALTKAKFAKFLRAVGTCPRNDLAAIDAALLDVYGEGVTALDERFVAWCKKR